MAATAVPTVKPAVNPRATLGKYVPGSGFCKWCWDRGFNGPRNQHMETACPWKAKTQARDGKRSAALVAPAGDEDSTYAVGRLFYGLYAR